MGAAAAVSIKSRTSSLSGLAGACGYTVFLVAGPWILIVFAIAGLSYGACPTDECASLGRHLQFPVFSNACWPHLPSARQIGV
jgi:hypothetical protein